MNNLNYAIAKDGKYMGAGSNQGKPEGTAWFDEPTGDVFKASKEGCEVQLKHLPKYTDMTGAKPVEL